VGSRRNRRRVNREHHSCASISSGTTEIRRAARRRPDPRGKPDSQRSKAEAGERQTVCWRKGDSNSWSHRKRDAVPITTYRSGGSLKSAARRIRNPGGSARETHGIGTPARCRAANRPSVTGMLSWVWVNALLMWAGMSSGPSSLWRYGATFSGTMRGRKASRSRLTSGRCIRLDQQRRGGVRDVEGEEAD
jgi:hypothetical protein